MTYKTILFLSIYILAFFFIQVLSASELYTVSQVYDGDTILLKNGWTIRYLGINSPEIKHGKRKGEPFGKAAKKFHTGLVKNKNVRLEYDTEKKDRYGRILAYVFLTDGTLVNAVLIENGLAHVLIHKSKRKYTDRFLQIQEKAMAKRLGIWEYWMTKTEKVYGNRRSMRFHTSTCKFEKKIHGKNRITFLNCSDSFKKGFAPCKHCFH